jgi:glycosyltransferase involved in cell wall biosynthesis
MVIVVPTRNRAQLAMNALRSVLEQSVDNVEVMVSDNSTSEQDREELAAFCANLSESRVRYVRPPEPFAMPDHWEWAIEQALSSYSASHFAYLTDRMMFRTGALKELLDLAKLYPSKVISYNVDRICDDSMPIRLEQYPATEKLVEVETLRLSRLFSQGIFHHGLPRMLNCIVPRDVFERTRQRFGNVFSSIAPDFNFCVRCFDVEESILFFDKSPLFHYALNRSLGASATRGQMTPDNADFTANLPVDNANRNYATPIPSLITAVNAAFNEYLIHKQQTMSPRFFDVDLQRYLAANALEVREVRDPKLRGEMMALLVERGYQEPANTRFLSRLRNLVRSKLKRPRPQTRDEAEFQFWELDKAIDYARNVSRGNVKPSSIELELLHGRELLKDGSRA